MRQVLCMLLFLLVTQTGYSQQGVEQLVKRFARSEQVEQAPDNGKSFHRDEWGEECQCDGLQCVWG